ncbi:MAG: serine protein kinase PrkA [Desulfobacterales bacterium]|nr:serine protein kinase PrkA [Desulfobacterales bacterium]MCP4163009.1 serine protein kinase PrkA [Deltaproteobacteria bacterium]
MSNTSKKNNKKASHITNAINNLDESMSEELVHSTMSFDEFLGIVIKNPSKILRNVFQVFHDMVKGNISDGVDEYTDDPESIKYLDYDCRKLFVDDTDHPFFADRLFANRFVSHVEAMKQGSQQNKIYIFEGPHGSGKSTFLNNLLRKFEEYSNSEEGIRYETVWRIDVKALGSFSDNPETHVVDRLLRALEQRDKGNDTNQNFNSYQENRFIEVPCVCHDNPILLIPKQYRRDFLDKIIDNDQDKWELFAGKEYEWVFKSTPCTICQCLYNALLSKLKKPELVYNMVHVKPYVFNRRLGEGISVFNPSDKPMQQNVFSNNLLQGRINTLFGDSNRVRYIFSQFAKTNNGIYSLMDVKLYNTDRLAELHNIVSEGVHKVEEIEENVDSLFIALMNPEDKQNIKDIPSFSDRIEFITIPYVLDMKTEVKIYSNIFGTHIKTSFLPRVLNNFARVIISSRLAEKSEALLEWIGDPTKYRMYCDNKLHLLKMEIFSGNIPEWLTEEDRGKFSAKRRRTIIGESIREGDRGFSGRDSIKIFNDFYSTLASDDKLISMSDLSKYFRKLQRGKDKKLISEGFLQSLLQMYDYTILQEVKESLYYYNEDQISLDIQNYMFAVNFEVGESETCTYTGERLEISEDFFLNIETRLMGKTEKNARIAYRKDIQQEYTTKTLTQEIIVEEKDITETKLFQSLHERYVHNIKEKVLDPFLQNENFRRAIKDYDKEDFKTYDKRIRNDVTFLIQNLIENFKYTEQGAKEVCIYVIDNDLAKKFVSKV